MKLTPDLIVNESLSLLDSKGPDGLSFRELGKHLGVSQTAFYRYFSDKDALLESIADLLWSKVLEDSSQLFISSTDPRFSTPQQETAWKYGLRLNQVLMDHPHAVTVFAEYSYDPNEGFTELNHLLTNSQGSQVATGSIHELMGAVTFYTIGYAMAVYHGDEISNTAQKQYRQGLRAIIQGW